MGCPLGTMGDEPEFSQDGVLNFLVEAGGRAANTELLHRFRGALGEPSARELFKGFVNAVGLVKQEDGAKYVVLKKKYKQHWWCASRQRGSTGRGQPRPTTEEEEMNAPMGPSPLGAAARPWGAIRSSRQRPRPRPSSRWWPRARQGGGVPLRRATSRPRRRRWHAAAPADASSQAVSSQGHAAASAEEDEGTTTPGSRSEAAEAEGSGSQDVGRPGGATAERRGAEGSRGQAVQTVRARRRSRVERELPLLLLLPELTPGEELGEGPFKTTSKKKLSAGSARPRVAPSEEATTPRRRRLRPRAHSSPPTLAAAAIQTPNPWARLEPARMTLRGGGGSSFGAPLALEPVEHEWIVSAAAGDWSNLHGLLLGEPSLALRRDPLTGYTALHWAAKHGKADMVPVLVQAAESSAGTADDVNVRSHGGYTALHLAAMHGHTDVAKMLVGAYEANVNARDYSGRKPWHYLGQDASWEIRELLEAPAGDGAERPAATEAARRKLPRPYLGSLRIPAGHGGGAGSDDEADGGGGGGGGGGNFLRDMQLMRRQSFAKLLKAPMNKKRHKTQIIHSSSSVRETRAKEEGDLPVGKVAL
uniref:LOW QUALITY PROTEIN: ankyrin repeat domain-containing protein SOWAHB-like n=1 Tax=Petromyzon marinus TaxID=7757 RepID=A0AAJ7T6I0_PETMA|nr:LOW QUALITY PROTEIN: ankyrin repeat domain-containing protein SOWAHB-like [Petromyzon marinus]